MKVWILIAICLFTIFNISYSQQSGWVDLNENVKQQLLVIPNLNSLAFSHDGSSFYTYNEPNKVYIWRTETGILLDSIILEDTPTKLFFSKDGYTFAYYVYHYDGNSTYYITDIYIFNLEDNSYISKATIDIINTMNYKKPKVGFIDDNYQINILDYKTETNLILISCEFHVLDVANLPYYKWFGDGLFGKFNVLKDTLILVNNLGSVKFFIS